MTIGLRRVRLEFFSLSTTQVVNHPRFLQTTGVLASAGAYVFAKNGSNYDLKNMGVGNRGAVEGLSKIIALIHAGVLPKSVSYSAVEDLMGQGKVAMIVSGPVGMVEPDQE